MRKELGMSNADHIGTGLLRKTMRIAVVAAAALVCAVIVVVCPERSSQPVAV